jgi:nucleotide-binding universal stress UspA family protein
METTPQDANVSVLVPLDGSHLAEHAIPLGRALAGPEGEVAFLEVLPTPEPIRGLLGDLVVSAEDAGEMYEEEARTRLTDAAERWKSVVGQVSVETRTGEPVDQILSFATEKGFSYIAMASHGKGALERLAFGSVADEISRTSPIPVLMIHPKGEAPAITPATIKRLIVPLDGSELAKAALPVVIDIAKRLKVPVITMQAITPEILATAYPATEGYYAADIYDELISQQEEQGKAEMEQEAERLKQAGIEATPMVLVGSAVDAVERIAEPGDIIVMTSHGRTGIRRFVLGSVAERLIRSGPAPVLLVPAPGRSEAPEEPSS